MDTRFATDGRQLLKVRPAGPAPLFQAIATVMPGPAHASCDILRGKQFGLPIDRNSRGAREEPHGLLDEYRRIAGLSDPVSGVYGGPEFRAWRGIRYMTRERSFGKRTSVRFTDRHKLG